MVVFLAMMLPWCVVGVGCWFLYRFGCQQTAILVRLKTIEQHQVQMRGLIQRRRQSDDLARFALEQQMQQAKPAPPPSGLPVGTPAPEFDLPDLAGQRHKLSDYRGRKVLLVFFNPGCGYCSQMTPDLANLPIDGGPHPVPVVITIGTPEANRQLVEQHQLKCPYLMDEKKEIDARYEASGTPTGYLIDENGVLASPLAIGARELLSLLNAEEGHVHGPAKGKQNKGLAASRIIRDGLKAGTPAPNFRLPKVGGGELALEDLRGQRVLLVLSDPECGPCNTLTPQLEQLHRRTPDVQFVMISRRDEEANRKKIEEHALTFPVVLQKQWEISRLFGIFATPVAYLIDENGIIVSDVAQGVEPILKLLTPPVGIRAAA